MHSWGNTCSERLNRAWGEPKTRERFSLGKDFFSSWLLRSSSKAKLRAERKEGRKEGRKKRKERGKKSRNRTEEKVNRCVTGKFHPRNAS